VSRSSYEYQKGKQPHHEISSNVVTHGLNGIEGKGISGAWKGELEGNCGCKEPTI